MVFLFLFIAAGYILMKMRLLPENSNTVLSRLENMLFIPALMLATFMKNFTVEKLSDSGRILLLSIALEIVIIPIAIGISRLCFSDAYLRKIATYGLSFANFGFMGNAVMQSLFPDIFMEYLVFTLPLWIFIMLWGVPFLLMSDEAEEAPTLKSRLKPLCNPMMICMLIGMILGLTGITEYIPESVGDAITVTGDCMSPVAMILTGITVAKSNLFSLIKRPRIYVLSLIRLVVIPILFTLLFTLIPKNSITDTTFLTCATAALAMPLGLNTIVVPGAYGKDTTDAASMALISHVLSIGTIPLVFMLFSALII